MPVTCRFGYALGSAWKLSAPISCPAGTEACSWEVSHVQCSGQPRLSLAPLAFDFHFKCRNPLLGGRERLEQGLFLPAHFVLYLQKYCGLGLGAFLLSRPGLGSRPPCHRWTHSVLTLRTGSANVDLQVGSL